MYERIVISGANAVSPTYIYSDRMNIETFCDARKSPLALRHSSLACKNTERVMVACAENGMGCQTRWLRTMAELERFRFVLASANIQQNFDGMPDEPCMPRECSIHIHVLQHRGAVIQMIGQIHHA